MALQHPPAEDDMVMADTDESEDEDGSEAEDEVQDCHVCVTVAASGPGGAGARQMQGAECEEHFCAHPLLQAMLVGRGRQPAGNPAQRLPLHHFLRLIAGGRMMEHGAQCGWLFSKPANRRILVAVPLRSRLPTDSTPLPLFHLLLHAFLHACAALRAGAAASNDDLVAGLKRSGVIQRQAQPMF